MKRLNQMIGLPVMCGERRLGFVSSLCLSLDAHDLIGMNMQRNFRGTVFIPGENIRALEDRRVQVAPAQCQKARKATRLGPVCDAEGMKLGLITDAAIEEKTLRVAALEITFGPMDDLLRGRCWIKRFTVDGVTGGIVIPEWGQDGVPELERGKPS